MKYKWIFTYKSVHDTVIPQMNERQILRYDWKERNLKEKQKNDFNQTNFHSVFLIRILKFNMLSEEFSF